MKKFTNIINESIDDNFDPKELEMGIKIESEHGDVYEELKNWMDKTYGDYSSMPWSEKVFYEKIAKSHLREMPDYYSRLIKMEEEK
jgi:hypothetical protein